MINIKQKIASVILQPIHQAKKTERLLCLILSGPVWGLTLGKTDVAWNTGSIMVISVRVNNAGNYEDEEAEVDVLYF